MVENGGDFHIQPSWDDQPYLLWVIIHMLDMQDSQKWLNVAIGKITNH